jgi:hypothetical protein
MNLRLPTFWKHVITVLGGATLRMETAMILDHETEQQRTCFGLVLYTATVTAFLVTALATLAHLLDVPAVRQLPWPALLTIGIGAWLTAHMQTTLAYATSHNAVGKAARPGLGRRRLRQLQARLLLAQRAFGLGRPRALRHCLPVPGHRGADHPDVRSRVRRAAPLRHFPAGLFDGLRHRPAAADLALLHRHADRRHARRQLQIFL